MDCSLSPDQPPKISFLVKKTCFSVKERIKEDNDTSQSKKCLFARKSKTLVLARKGNQTFWQQYKPSVSRQEKN
jgi:hypothetical protein